MPMRRSWRRTPTATRSPAAGAWCCACGAWMTPSRSSCAATCAAPAKRSRRPGATCCRPADLVVVVLHEDHRFWDIGHAVAALAWGDDERGHRQLERGARLLRADEAHPVTVRAFR